MERNKKTPPLLLLLLALLHVCTIRMEDCPSLPENLTCYTDYNRTITCVWNSTYVSDHADTVCTIHGKKDIGFKFSTSCNLKTFDVSRSTLQKCSLVFKRDNMVGNSVFQSFTVLSIDLSCNPVKQSLYISFKPSCHIKLNPPPKPDINSTTISWFPKVTNTEIIQLYSSHLQWKQEDQSWSDPSVQNKVIQCDGSCTAELDPDLLIQDERYEARIRLQASDFWAKSTWSDWSPSASWESLIGKTKPSPPPSDVARVVVGIVAAALVLAVFLAIITDKTTWVLKRIRGLPPLNPANSFLKDANFQNWLSPHFTSESINSFLKPVEIVSVEITSTMDAVVPYGPEAALQEKMRSKRNHELTSSNFSNPSYSQLCSSPVSSLTEGNLPPCASDTPYGPVGSQCEGENAEQDRDEVREKEGILQLLSKGSNNTESMPVISDYEKVEKLQAERIRLQSLDSGMCSGEEVSQESLEADSISGTDSHDEQPEGKEEREGGNGKEGDFQKQFGGSGGIFGKGSIQVCPDYERVQILQADSPELPSLDPGISSGAEEQVSQDESLEHLNTSTETTSLLFPPPPSALPCSLPSSMPLPLNLFGPALSPALPLPSHILEGIALMSTNTLVDPSGDGYLPVRQEQSLRQTESSSVGL